MAQQDERREYGRVELDEPLTGSLDMIPVSIVEVSVTGFRVEHDVRLPQLPLRRLAATWRANTMEFSCSIVRSLLYRLARRAGEKTIYHSGVKIEEAVGDSDRVIRELIAERVIRALEEQKANAQGIPPIGAYLHQVEKGDRFRRCELTNGVWRKFETTSPQQPENGFTISAAASLFNIEMLCHTFEQTTEEGRRLTQILAQLSISKKEGTPVRRYLP